MSDETKWKFDIETFARMQHWLSVMTSVSARLHAIQRMQEIKGRWPQYIKDAIPES